MNIFSLLVAHKTTVLCRIVFILQHLWPDSQILDEVMIQLLFIYTCVCYPSVKNNDQIKSRLHMSSLLGCRDMRKVVSWMGHQNTNNNKINSHKIPIKISQTVWTKCFPDIKYIAMYNHQNHLFLGCNNSLSFQQQFMNQTGGHQEEIYCPHSSCRCLDTF